MFLMRRKHDEPDGKIELKKSSFYALNQCFPIIYIASKFWSPWQSFRFLWTHLVDKMHSFIRFPIICFGITKLEGNIFLRSNIAYKVFKDKWVFYRFLVEKLLLSKVGYGWQLLKMKHLLSKKTWINWGNGTYRVKIEETKHILIVN